MEQGQNNSYEPQPQSYGQPTTIPYEQQQSTSSPQQPQAQPQMPPTPPSPFSRAWQDIKHTPNAVSTYGFKGLVNCIPILNFCFYGNAGNWQRQAADGIVAPIESNVITKSNFISGACFFLISLILSFVLGAVTMVPILGLIVAFVASFFVETFALLMYQRYLSFGSLGDAFNIKDIFDKCKRNFGQLWVATFVPGLIIGIIAIILCVVIFIVFGMLGGALMITMGHPYLIDSIGAILYIFIVLGIGGFLCFLTVMFAGVIINVWAMRGCGYWVQDNVPEWNSATARYTKQQQQEAQQAAAYCQQQAAQQPQQSPQQPQSQQYAGAQPNQYPVSQSSPVPYPMPQEPQPQQPQQSQAQSQCIAECEQEETLNHDEVVSPMPVVIEEEIIIPPISVPSASEHEVEQEQAEESGTQLKIDFGEESTPNSDEPKQK